MNDQSTADTILERLVNDRVVEVLVSPDRTNVTLRECCDGYFDHTLTKPELFKLIDELTEIAHSMAAR